MAKGLAGTTLISDANLVSYFKLEDVSDSKGSNTLTNHNTVPFNVAKFDNGADGGASNTNKWLSRASNLGLAYSASKTFSLWVKLNAEIGSSSWTFGSIRSTTGSGIFEFNYEYNGGTRRIFAERYSDTSGVEKRSTSNTALGTSNWHHLAIVFDATGHTLELFVDGVSAGQTTGVTDNGGGAGSYVDGFGLLAGPDGSAPSSAILDDVAIFSRALSSGEITTIYNSPVGGDSGFLALL